MHAESEIEVRLRRIEEMVEILERKLARIEKLQAEMAQGGEISTSTRSSIVSDGGEGRMNGHD